MAAENGDIERSVTEKKNGSIGTEAAKQNKQSKKYLDCYPEIKISLFMITSPFEGEHRG